MTYEDYKDLARRTDTDKVLLIKLLIKHLMLLKIKNMMNIKEVLLLWFINFLMKSLKVIVFIMKLNKMSNWQQNYTNKLLKNLENFYIYRYNYFFIGISIVNDFQKILDNSMRKPNKILV